MFTRTLVVGAAALILTAGPAAAQKNPEVAVSWDANVPLDAATPANRQVDRLTVRPNQVEPYYVYIYNPNDAPKQYAVVLAKGAGKGAADELAKVTITVDAEKALRVPFVAPPPPPPPTPPVAAPPAAAGQPAAVTPPANPGKPLDGQIIIRILNPTTGKEIIAKKLFVEILPLANYISEEGTSATYSRSKNRLDVVIAKKKGDEGTKSEFENRPCKVKLTLRPESIDGLIKESVLDGTFEAELSEQGPDTVTLFAENLRFTDGVIPKGRVEVAVDGVERALVYNVSFAADNTTGTPLKFDESKPRLVPVNGLWFAAPGKPFPVRIEVDAVPAADGYLLAAQFDRSGTGTTQPLMKKDSRVRDDKVTAQVGGVEGGILLQATRADWVVDIDTAGVVGKRKVTVAVTKPDRTLVDGGEQILTLDRTAPVNVTLVPKKKAGERGTVLKVSASGQDAESGVTKVFFYVGDAPGADGKAAPGSKVVAKDLGGPKTDRVEVLAELPLPDVKGRVQIGVRFVNILGMTTDKVEEVDVVDPPKPKDKEAGATTGTVKGKVGQGAGNQVRPQPGLKVELRGPDGKAIKSTTSNEEGKFEFKDVPPGEYTVFSIKPIDAGAKGSKPVTVEAGKTAEATVSLLR